MNFGVLLWGATGYTLGFNTIGTATVYLNTKNRIIGFNDYYDFDPKSIKERGLINEIKTRLVSFVSPQQAKPFIIKYGY